MTGLNPCGELAEAALLISEMFMSFASVRMTEQQAEKTASAYLAQVQHLPLWAIETGCQSCIARDLAFPPSAGELRAACERVVQPSRDEEAEIRKVLDAEVYHSRPDAERERVNAGFACERVNAGFAKLLDDLKANDVSRPRNGTDRRHDYPLGRRHRAQDRREAKEPVPDGRPLPTLGDEALAKYSAKYADSPFVEAE